MKTTPSIKFNRPTATAQVGCSPHTGFTPLTAVAETTTQLQRALAKFNTRFDMRLATPIWPETLEAAAEYSQLRGRDDIAKELRAAKKQDQAVCPGCGLERRIEEVCRLCRELAQELENSQHD